MPTACQNKNFWVWGGGGQKVVLKRRYIDPHRQLYMYICCHITCCLECYHSDCSLDYSCKKKRQSTMKTMSYVLSMMKFWSPPQKNKKRCCFTCSIWRTVMRALSDYWHPRDAVREDVWVHGWRTAWHQQRASFKPVSYDFPTQRKAIVILKKVKLKA